MKPEKQDNSAAPDRKAALDRPVKKSPKLARTRHSLNDISRLALSIVRLADEIHDARDAGDYADGIRALAEKLGFISDNALEAIGGLPVVVGTDYADWRAL